jgi:hypothetical protein
MNTQKITQKTATNGLLQVAGMVLGFMLGGAVSAAVPAESRTISRAGLAIGGVAGATMIKGNDAQALILKAAGLGVSAREVYGLATDYLKKNTTVSADPTLLEKLKLGAIGLACPCDGSYGASARMPSLAMPMLETSYNEFDGSYEVQTSNNNSLFR